MVKGEPRSEYCMQFELLFYFSPLHYQHALQVPTISDQLKAQLPPIRWGGENCNEVRGEGAKGHHTLNVFLLDLPIQGFSSPQDPRTGQVCKITNT